MNKSILNLVFCLSLTTISAQNFSIEISKMNILYAGVENPVSISAENISSKKLIVTTDIGKIEGKNGTYFFSSNKTGSATFTVYQTINGKRKFLGRKIFSIRNVPNPVFKIGSGKERVSKLEIASQEYVRADVDYFEIDTRFHIDSFNVAILSNYTCKVIQRKNIGNKLNQTIRNDFANLKPGDVIVFRNIHFRRLDGVPSELVPTMVTISD